MARDAQRSCSSTSTTSRRSTIHLATQPVTSSCALSPSGCAHLCAPATSPSDSAAMSSASWSRTRSPAKPTGKGGYSIFQPRFYAAVVRRHALKGDLQRAVDDGCFVLYYQPIVELATGATRSVEALLRWQHPERGIVMPAEFITFAEE